MSLNINNKIKSEIIVISIILTFTLIFAFLFKAESILHFISINTLIVYLIYLSNRFFFKNLLRLDKISNINYIKLLVALIGSYFTGAFVYSLVLYFWMKFYINYNFIDFSENLSSYLITYSAIFLIVSLLHLVLNFFKGWKNEMIENERKRYKELKFEHEILKSQLNPHFLFNSLNILNSIISKDTEQAKRFVQNFSKIYRYVLDKRDFDYVNLEDELNFIESYLYLIKSRHLDRINIKIDIPSPSKYSIIPMSLQLLIENAIKHNAATKENPLEIKIILEDDFIVVCNNINKKNVFEKASKIGLKNLSERYKYQTNKDIDVTDTNEKFIVRLPIISLKNR